MPSLDEIKAQIAKNTSTSSAGMKSDMEGGGCSDELKMKVLDTLQNVNNLNKNMGQILSPDKLNAATDLNLQFQYANKKQEAKNAPLNYDIAEKAYITNKSGSAGYQTLLNNRYEKTGNNELAELNKYFTDSHNLTNDLIVAVGEQDIAEKNMKRLLKKLETENEKLNETIGEGSSTVHTYNRKSIYESKLTESVKNWTVFPSIIYWTLLILWIGIVLIYLRNITYKTIGLLIGLILYPYFSTDIILFVLSKIQTLWTFIFTAVQYRISA